MNLRSFSVRNRLTVAFATLCLVFLAMSGASLWLAHFQTTEIFANTSQSEQQQSLVAQWQEAVAKNLVRTTALLLGDTPTLTMQFQAELTEGETEIDVLQKKVEPTLKTAAQHTAFTHIVATRKAYNDLRTTALSTRQNHGQLAVKDAIELNTAMDGYREAVKAVGTLVHTDNAALVSQLQAQANHAALVAGAVALAVVLGALAFGVLIARSITKPLSQAVDVLTRVSEGDFCVTLNDTSKDELGRLSRRIQTMVTSVSDVLGGMQQSSEAVRMASQEIAAGNQDLSGRTEAMASNLEESSSAVEELTTAVASNAQVSNQARELASQATSISDTATASVASIEETMRRIHEASAKVGDIVTVIDGIAFQTNILALNASIEAAHAGEGGRGFAVVASEVRNLASRSAQSAREIKAVVEQTLSQIAHGVEQSRAAGQTVSVAREKVVEVQAMMSQIAEASQDQASGLREISRGISALDATTQQNSAMVEQSAAAAQSLSEQAAQLNELSNRFRLA